MPGVFFLRDDFVVGEGDGNADAAPHIPHFVALNGMAFEAGRFHHQRFHMAQVTLALQPGDLADILHAPLEALQGAGLPGVGGVGRTQGFETGDVAPDAVPAGCQFVELAGHVGGVHQGQGLAIGSGDIPVR